MYKLTKIIIIMLRTYLLLFKIVILAKITHANTLNLALAHIVPHNPSSVIEDLRQSATKMIESMMEYIWQKNEYIGIVLSFKIYPDIEFKKYFVGHWRKSNALHKILSSFYMYKLTKLL